MAKVKLIKASSYTGAIRVTSKQPIVDVSEDEAQALIATGYFEPYASTEQSTSESKDNIPDYEALSEMTKAELLAYAKENNIDTEKCKTKADILEVISVANGGSPTMIDLQRKIS